MASRSDIAVSVQGLSKSYTIAHNDEKHSTLAETMLARLKNPFGRPAKETFWALNDVTFNIKKGEVVGIIGRNGAGKSTLLKVLSRITEPTKGAVDMFGRVGSLLEVGTGFHAELTGRENVYLNGAILGMNKAEIRKQFDAIVQFAEVEKFLDTPVKRYSSGMYVRLAFAVAAHLRTEILVVDEVLAVGDVDFQKKCLGKMKDVAIDGRTVLFVSHNLAAIRQICSTAILLQDGRLADTTNRIDDVMATYLRPAMQTASSDGLIAIPDHQQRREQWFAPTAFTLTDDERQPVTYPVARNSRITVRIEADIAVYNPLLTIGYALYSADGSLLYISYHTDMDPSQWPQFNSGKWEFQARVPTELLNPGAYRIELVGGLHCQSWLYEPGKNAPEIRFEITNEWLSPSPLWTTQRRGLLAPIVAWDCRSKSRN